MRAKQLRTSVLRALTAKEIALTTALLFSEQQKATQDAWLD